MSTRYPLSSDPHTMDAPSRVDSHVSTRPEVDGFTIAALAATIEHFWYGVLRPEVPDLPDVAILLAPSAHHPGGLGVLGSWSPGWWCRQRESEDRIDARIGEVFLSAEHLRRGPEELLDTVLHEAAHALGTVRNLRTASRQGRYHNRTFKRLAESLGLEVIHSALWGWSRTELSAESKSRYAVELEQIARTTPGYRSFAQLLPDPPPGLSRHPEAAPVLRSSSLRRLACGCEPPRLLRGSRAAIARGPVLCGVCDCEFAEGGVR